MLRQNFQCNHYIGNCSFVIGAEDRSSVTDNQILPDVLQKFRMLFYGDENLLFFILADVSALIISNNDGMNLR